MTAVAPQPIATRPYPARQTVKGSFLARMFRTTDHKQIGILYLVLAFFLVEGRVIRDRTSPLPPFFLSKTS